MGVAVVVVALSSVQSQKAMDCLDSLFGRLRYRHGANRDKKVRTDSTRPDDNRLINAARCST